MIVALVLLGMALLALTIYLAVLSRHKKSGVGTLDLIGATGLVQSALAPEGAVIIDGELWRARATDGSIMAVHERVRVIGVEGHLVLVESLSDKL